MKPSYDIQQQSAPSPEDIKYVRDQLIAFNNQQSGEFPSKSIHLFVRDPNDQIIGALFGEISWGWLNVQTLWVDKTYRHQGIATSLMDRAEAGACNMGVHKAFTETTSFQALGFYEKRGYQIFGQLEDLPPGHICYYLKNEQLP